MCATEREREREREGEEGEEEKSSTFSPEENEIWTRPRRGD